MYYDHAEALAKIPNHRVLAINRGEKEKKLKVKISVDAETMHEVIRKIRFEERKVRFLRSDDGHDCGRIQETHGTFHRA